MNSKKGLSDVVTNVLIILLVLVAVGIIWAFLRPTIEAGAGGLGGAADCLTVQLEPVSCIPGGDIVVKRGAGSGDLNSIKVVVTNSAGSNVYPKDAIDELGSSTITDINAAANDVITVAAVVNDGNGGTKTCTESSVSVTCS